MEPYFDHEKLRSRQEITYPFGLPFCSLAASLLNYRTKAMRIRRSLPGNKIAKEPARNNLPIWFALLLPGGVAPQLQN